MKSKSIKRNRNSSKAFTLVELLIAISILSISILATFTAVSNNLRSSNFAEDQVVAYYLADEGIEYVRNVRDQNGIANIVAFGSGGAPVSWLDGISQFCITTACAVDSPHPSPAQPIASCSGDASTCPYLLIDCPSITGSCVGRSGLYGYTAGWTPTQFKRSIKVNVTSATEAVVASTVSWVTNGVSKSYTLSDILRAWQ